MKRNLLAIIILVSFISNTRSQTIQGFVTDTSSVGVYGVSVQAILQNDTTKRKATITDFSGYYELKDITTGINDIPGFSGDKMTIAYNGSQMEISVISNKFHIINAKLYDVTGRTLAGTHFQQVGPNEFKAVIGISGVPEQMLLFSDGVHPAEKIILGMLPSYGAREIDLSAKSQNENGFLKSTRTSDDEDTFIFRLDDNQDVDEYQPLQVVKSADMENTNYFDFEMEKWPEFFSNMFFNLQDKYGNIQQNTNMNVNSLDGSYSFNISTDNNGDAQITNISIPHVEGNKLIPDSIDFAVEIPANDYLETKKDTLWKVSQGDIIKNYHNLTPKQQEFFANLYATIESEQTGNPIENVLTQMWKENSTDTLEVFTNSQGQANFENINIDAFNEITPDTLKHFLRFSGVDLETKTDSINLTSGNFNQTYQITEINNPEPKDYTLIINSQDGEGNNLPGVNWLVLSSDSVLIGEGNTGSNSLDTLLFQDLNDNKNIILKSNKNEHTNYRLETNLTAETIENRITENSLLEYLYELGVVGKDSETGVALDSVDVRAFLNGELLMNGNSLQDTITNLQTTMPGHTLDLKLLMERAGYIKSDSIPITINEGEQNELIYELVKEETTPTENKGVIRTRFVDPLAQNGTTADFIFTNNTLGVADTIFNVPNQQIITDTVEVVGNGPTTYTIKVIPHVLEGNIPLYTTEETVDIYKDQTTTEQIDPLSLEQQQKIKGKVVYGDTKTNATYIDVIIRDTNGNTVDSLTTTDGYYEFGPYSVGFEGTMDAHIRNTHPNRADTLYFGHRGIPIVKESESVNYTINTGRLVFKEKVTEFEDSVKTYNISMTPAFWVDAETGTLAKVNPAHIQKMDGNVTYDMPMLAFGESNVFFESTTTDKQYFFDLAQRINDNFGIPFVVNEVGAELPTNGINITSLDQNYLNSVKNSMGINAEVYSGTSGLTYPKGNDELEDVDVHSVTNIRIRAPTDGNVNQYILTSGYRELIHRMLNATNIPLEYYKSIGNSSTPNDLDTTKMVYDHINYSLIHNHRKMRIDPEKNERVGNGSWTIRPNNNSDFYTTKTQTELYYEERWKAWDHLNIPPFNKKFFPNTPPYQIADLPLFVTTQGDTLVIENWIQYFNDIEGDELHVEDVRISSTDYIYNETETNIEIVLRNLDSSFIGHKTGYIVVTDGELSTMASFEWNIEAP